MTMHPLLSRRAWVFDLDNTLYSPTVRLFDQIDLRITAWVQQVTGADAQEADRLRRHYWNHYGTTLAGLMAEHHIDADAYLEDVHDISFDALTPDRALEAAIAALPGRKIVYTNGSAPYARRVLAARGLSDAFDAVYGVEDAGLIPKPQRSAFETIFSKDQLDPREAVMFEDDPRNLAAPKAMGMATIHVADAATHEAHIDHHTDDLSAFLHQLLPR